MARKPLGMAMVLAGTTACALAIGAAVTLPLAAQESLLPPGFDQPPPRSQPAPAPSPAPTPTPSPTTSGRPAPRPTPGVTAAPGATPARPVPGGAGNLPLDALTGEDGLGVELPEAPRYDLPAGSRRSLQRVGPLGPETGSLPVGAFGTRGRYLTVIMDNVQQPLVSRWAYVLLRRAMLSAADTPRNVDGADFAAARAALLLRQGDAAAARLLVQAVDVDKATDRMRAAALQVYIANADPGGLCPYAPAMAGPDRTWQLVRAMCASLVGETGTASAGIERVQRSGDIAAIDVKLAEKIVGAGLNASRSVRIVWDGVDRLTPWRLGLATASGVTIPDGLWNSASMINRRWAVQMPMIDLQRRLSLAADAATAGTLSSRAYVDLVSAAAAQDEPSPDAADLAATLRGAFVYRDLPDRLAAIGALSGLTGNAYAGRVLAARAAARVAPIELSDGEQFMLLSSMFAGGLDNNAMAWATSITVGSQSWGLLAVGSPRPLVGDPADSVGDFADGDDSPDGLRTRFLAAALAGLGRTDADGAATLAERYDLDLNRSTRWTRAITLAADRNEAGTVALLVAVGLQGRDWSAVPPYHVYHITAALRRVGLGAEARMIAAEALSRV